MTETPPKDPAAGESTPVGHNERGGLVRKYTAEIWVEADTVEGLKKALKAAADKMRDQADDLDATRQRVEAAAPGSWQATSLWRGGTIEAGCWDVKTTRA